MARKGFNLSLELIRCQDNAIVTITRLWSGNSGTAVQFPAAVAAVVAAAAAAAERSLLSQASTLAVGPCRLPIQTVPVFFP